MLTFLLGLKQTNSAYKHKMQRFVIRTLTDMNEIILYSFMNQDRVKYKLLTQI